MNRPYVPLTDLPVLRAALDLIHDGDSPTANADEIGRKLDLHDETVQKQLAVLEPLFGQVLHGDDRNCLGRATDPRGIRRRVALVDELNPLLSLAPAGLPR
jgi:hypothetical protein